MDYIISAENGATETVFLRYKEEQRRVRNHVAMLWQQATATLAAYQVFGEEVANGELAPVAGYHAAVAGQLAGAEALLLAKIGEVAGLIEQIQNAAPGNLFPGVPKANAPED